MVSCDSCWKSRQSCTAAGEPSGRGQPPAAAAVSLGHAPLPLPSAAQASAAGAASFGDPRASGDCMNSSMTPESQRGSSK